MKEQGKGKQAREVKNWKIRERKKSDEGHKERPREGETRERE